MSNHWLEQLKKELAGADASKTQVERLEQQGIIDSDGRVTGHLHRWDSDMVVTQVKYDSSRNRIVYYRCFLPVFGIPGGATIDVSRDNLVSDLKKGSRIITAFWDDKLGLWKEGERVFLAEDGHVKTQSNGTQADNLGNLPEFSVVKTRL